MTGLRMIDPIRRLVGKWRCNSGGKVASIQSHNSKGFKMKKLAMLAAVSVFSLGGLAYSGIHSNEKIEGYWFGNILKDDAAGVVMCDNNRGVAYLGLYSGKRIPGVLHNRACNLSIAMDVEGKATLQVVDPADGKIYHLDLLALAKSNGKAID